MPEKKPLIAVPIGDPAGVGPEIVAKTLDFDRTISITNGLPILRTSVDHGTAFDIAGKGIVSEVSMAEAILLAAKYAPFFAKD